jgi:hypothetical protein
MEIPSRIIKDNQIQIFPHQFPMNPVTMPAMRMMSREPFIIPTNLPDRLRRERILSNLRSRFNSKANPMEIPCAIKNPIIPIRCR